MIELSIYSGFSLFKKMHRDSMEEGGQRVKFDREMAHT